MSALGTLLREGARLVDTAVTAARQSEPAVGEGLVVQHSVSRARAEAILDNGGRIPSPSVGVLKETSTKLMDDFGGDVTFIGEPKLLNDGRLYETDVYGVRHPTTHEQYIDAPMEDDGQVPLEMKKVFYGQNAENMKKADELEAVAKAKFKELDALPYDDSLADQYAAASKTWDEASSLRANRPIEATPENVLKYFEQTGDVLTEDSGRKRLPGHYIGEILADVAEAFPVKGLEGAKKIRDSMGPLPPEARDFQSKVSAFSETMANNGWSRNAGPVFLSEYAKAVRAGMNGPASRMEAAKATIDRVGEKDLAPMDMLHQIEEWEIANDRSVADLGEYIATTPKEYMEQRPGRIVELGKDFKAAIVPEGKEYDDLIPRLHDKGIAIIRVKNSPDESGYRRVDPDSYKQAMDKLRKIGKVFVFGGTAVGAGLLVDGTTNQAMAAQIGEDTGEPRTASPEALGDEEGARGGVASPSPEVVPEAPPSASTGLAGVLRAGARGENPVRATLLEMNRRLGGRPDVFSQHGMDRATEWLEQRNEQLGGTRRPSFINVRRPQAQTESTTQETGDMSARGIRNNNPGNIDFNPRNNWQGQLDHDPAVESRFARFDKPESGIRAMGKLLQTYQTKHKLNTVEGIINRWAPSVENNSEAYVAQVSKALGVNPNETVNLKDSDTLFKLVKAIIKHENGTMPYDDNTILNGVRAIN